MNTYIVRAWETMEATYEVKADSAFEAREKVESIGTHDDTVVQIDAMVFEVDCRTIEEIHGHSAERS